MIKSWNNEHGDIAKLTKRKIGTKWEIELKISTKGVHAHKAVLKALELCQLIVRESPTHNFGCECDLCDFWKEQDAVRRLGVGKAKSDG